MRKIQMLVLALAVLLVGCGDGTGPSSITGHYALQSVAGKPLPATLLIEGDYRSEITGGSVQLNADKSYAFLLLIQGTEGGTATTRRVESAGAYEQNGSAVTLDEAGTAGYYTASLAGSTLTMTVAGLPLVFRK